MIKAISPNEVFSTIKQELNKEVPEYIIRKINEILIEQVKNQCFFDEYIFLIPFTDIDNNITPSLEFSIKTTYAKEGWKVTTYNDFSFDTKYKIVRYLQFQYAK